MIRFIIVIGCMVFVSAADAKGTCSAARNKHRFCCQPENYAVCQERFNKTFYPDEMQKLPIPYRDMPWTQWPKELQPK